MCRRPELLLAVFDSAAEACLHKNTIFARLLVSRLTRRSLDDEIIAVSPGVIAALAQLIRHLNDRIGLGLPFNIFMEFVSGAEVLLTAPGLCRR